MAADANSAGEMYPDQSLYPYDSAPKLVETMNNSLTRADQIQHMEIIDGDMEKSKSVDYMLPIIADGEAGFGGPLNVFELTKNLLKQVLRVFILKINLLVKKNVVIWVVKCWCQQAQWLEILKQQD